MSIAIGLFLLGVIFVIFVAIRRRPSGSYLMQQDPNIQNIQAQQQSKITLSYKYSADLPGKYVITTHTMKDGAFVQTGETRTMFYQWWNGNIIDENKLQFASWDSDGLVLDTMPDVKHPKL